VASRVVFSSIELVSYDIGPIVTYIYENGYDLCHCPEHTQNTKSVYIYIYIYRERERERERDKGASHTYLNGQVKQQ
jgi:hypothetical protein